MLELQSTIMSNLMQHQPIAQAQLSLVQSTKKKEKKGFFGLINRIGLIN